MQTNDIIFHGNNNLDNIIIHWLPTDYCNYSCSYCISHSPHIIKNINFIDIQILKNTVDKIYSIKKNKYIFMFSGGEPTIYPYFKELCNYILQNNNSYIYLFSNTHKSTDYFSELFEIENFYLNFSIHLEYANIEHVKDIIKYANEKNKYIMISLMMNPDLKEKYILFFDELLEYRYKYFFGMDLGIIHNNKQIDSRYIEEDILWFHKSSKKFEEVEKINIYRNDIPDYFQDHNTKYIFSNDKIEHIPHRVAIAKEMKNFNNFYCCQGLNSITIDSNGFYKGIECGLGYVIGNIYYDDINYLELIKPIKCSLNGCNCRVNNYVPKYINEYNAKNKINDYIENIIPKKYLYNILIDLKDEFSNTKNIINKLENENVYLKSNMDKVINTIAWWIPIKKWRNNFKKTFE
uniref:radical SAM protein n=1 Tax=Brachyspira catarrhinii TaxID=2528966 RepID=UPI003F4C2617